MSNKDIYLRVLKYTPLYTEVYINPIPGTKFFQFYWREESPGFTFLQTA